MEREDWTLVEDHLYLSGILSVNSQQTLLKLNIKKVLTVDIKPIERKPPVDDYMFIRVNDHWDEDLISYFEPTYEFIKEGQITGRNVIVHCVGGVSRSATIVIAYLMNKYKWSYLKTFRYLEKKRSIIDPNYGFKEQLKLFEEMGFKINTSNKTYRNLLLKNLSYKLRYNAPWRSFVTDEDENPIESYFNKLRISKPSTDGCKCGYKCKKCRHLIFLDLNVVRENNDTVLIEPLESLKVTLLQSHSGSLNCPHCCTKLGSFNWNDVKEENKLLGKAIPVLKISCKKIDRSLIDC
ncbi:dual specificity protein phosphatase MPK-4-like protein [Dinothrombium tinctorium]|uniref:protein-tyrosine-phosphatase n=1 Tax=Dinothrombium tinctorium TaxID=1965070 RepID=A0A3S3NXQ7_9ACAR|nr:dual specificity protein phosphatase MPK-4-like protein [Dinothrombium tinctorium]